MAGDRCIRRGVGNAFPRLRTKLQFCAGVAREGDERLSGNQAGDARDGTKSSPASRSSKDRKKDKGNVVGRALRTVYDETLREDIPDDFLDLLGKLA